MRVREIVQAAGLAVVGLVVAPQCVLAQGANLLLNRQSMIYCPAANRQMVLFLFNGVALSETGPAQTIAAGTVMQMAFSAPVTSAGGVNTFSDVGPRSFSGNVLTVTFQTNKTLPYDSALSFSPVLDLQGVPSGTPITVTVTTNPANAVTFAGGANTSIIAMVDAGVCQPAPASAFTIEELTSTCPSAQEVASGRRWTCGSNRTLQRERSCAGRRRARPTSRASRSAPTKYYA